MKGTSIIEISEGKFKRNFTMLKEIAKKSDSKIMAVVKSNAYGHGLITISKLAEKYGADFLGVNSVEEAVKLNEENLKLPILIMGYVPFKDLKTVARYSFQVVMYNMENILKLNDESKKVNKISKIHLKIETGTNRQGIKIENLRETLDKIALLRNIKIEGIYTHFANIEDTTDYSYAKYQLEKFLEAKKIIGNKSLIYHTACSAATILFPETHFNLVRTGISMYGLWPSMETFLSAKEKGLKIKLEPILTWKSIIAQIKNIPKGSYVGYGCTYKALRDLKIGIIPVGYFEGYPRALSNKSYVIVKNKRAPVIGRICMNMMIVNLTDIENVGIEDEVILIGKSENEEVSADHLARLTGTINYEIVTRIAQHIPRILVR